MIYLNTLSEKSALFAAIEHKRALGNCEECKMYFHVHPSAELLIVTDGELTVHFLDGKSEKIPTGEAALIFPFNSHSYDRPEGTEYYRLNFMPSLVQSFFSSNENNVGEKSVFKINLDEYRVFFDNLRNNELTLYKVKGFLYNVIADFEKQITFIEKTSDGSVLNKVIDYIVSNKEKKLTLHSVSSALGYNEKYLSRRINQSSGLGFPALVSMLRIDAAGYMLKNSNRTIEDIAVACGFGSECTFYRIFKEITGCTPKEYRSQAPRKLAIHDAVL